jgi:hypothetical protein
VRIVAFKQHHAAADGHFQRKRPPPQHHRPSVRAGMARRRGVNPDTVTALVATIIEQNTERVKSVASSVTGAGGEEMVFVKSLRLFSKSFSSPRTPLQVEGVNDYV